MKRAIVLAAGCLVLFAALCADAREGQAGPGSVPRVAYTNPISQSAVDISDGKAVVFAWAMLPIPGGTRDSYRFVLHKGDGYDMIFEKVMDPQTFSIEVPAGKFEAGMKYWWYVRQRDARTMEWSQYDTWYFKVVKK